MERIFRMRTGVQPINLVALIIILMLYPVLLMFTVPAIHTGTSPESISYLLMDKSNLHITLNTVNSGIHTLTTDPGNGLVIRVQVSNANGAGVPGAGVKLEASNETGSFHPSEGITDAYGSFLSVYTPPAALSASQPASSSVSQPASILAAPDNTLLITAHLSGTEKSSTVQIKLVPPPVVLIHGYQTSPTIFSGLSEYLKLQGFTPLSFSYASENGVAPAAAELSDYLYKKTIDLKDSGIQVKSFDIIAHSMGGLVARYYTCSSDYSEKGNVRKLIFISVPQKGSPFASLGLQYYDDSGIRDLVPDSGLYSSAFPSMINAGLNPSIQTGSLLGKFDEVVGAESAGLVEWKIATELFDVGDSNFTIDKLLTGEILQAANHKLVLYNRKVYQRVQQMLESSLALPAVK